MSKFFDYNRKVCNYIGNRFKIFNININQEYLEAISAKIRPDMLIYDIGGGKNCSYLNGTNHEDYNVYALDISPEELSQNSKVKGKIVADVSQEIPLPYGKIDMITSSSVLEHLTNQEAFIKNSSNALKDNGYFIHVFPSKFALFAIINQLLPKKLSRKILFILRPDTKRTSGFPAYYKDTYYSAFMKLLSSNGFVVEKIACQYYQSDYFNFFAPFYFISLLWDSIWCLLGAKNMASYMCVIAKRLERK